jgi:predicted GTPase
LDPSVFDDLVTLHRDDTRNVIDHLASKMRILTEAIQSEGWHDHENYRAVVKNVPQMLKSLTEQSLHHSPKDILKSQFLKIRDRLKVIEAAMYPMNLSLLVDLMPKASTSHQDMRGKKVSLLIGSSQAGKSTILNFLAGANLKKVCPDGILRFRLKNIPESLPQETKQALQHVAIGSGYRSETIHVRLIPVRHNGSFLYLCDAPGFGDDRGPEIDISNGIGVISALKKCLKVKIILVVSGDEKGTKNEGLERVFTKVSDLISINPNESRQKLIYLLNNAEDITNFHDWICGVYKNKPPQDTAIKRIFEDAMCKSCCEECSILRAARSDPHQGPVPAYDSVHLSIARVLATRSAATSNSDELSPIESQEHPNFRQIFAKQVQCKLTQEELSKTALGSKFRSHFLDYVARDDMEIDPNSLRFICSEESIARLLGSSFSSAETFLL